jgi:CBS domain containing-hemolysin-like protein
VFGKITPETAPQAVYTQSGENVFQVAGEMKLNAFNDLTNFGIADPRMTTIGGVTLRALDRLPQVGDKVMVEGVELTVLEMKGHRITKLQASKGASVAESVITKETTAPQ